MKTATAKDLRHRTASVLDAVRRGQKLIITYRGRSVAALVPLDEASRKTLSPIGFGMWRGRREMRNVARWLRDLRAPRHRR